MNRKLLNFVSFQVGWFSCVLGAANGSSWLGPLVASAVVLFHVLTAEKAINEVRLVLIAVTLGLVCDGFLLNSGWIKYNSASAYAGIAPYWILAMWAMFATTLNLSMSWLKSSLLLSSVLGAIFGPLSYFAGQRLGAIEIQNFGASVVALAIIWAIAMPLLMFAASRFDGVAKSTWVTPLAVIPDEE